MRLDLSSYITLERVPQRYYKPENDFEEYTLSRFEKIPTHIYEKQERAAKKVAGDILKQMRKKEAESKPFVLGLSGGSSPLPVFAELVRLHQEEKVSFKNLVVFNIYEFYPIIDPQLTNLQLIKDSFLRDEFQKSLRRFIRYFFLRHKSEFFQIFGFKIFSLDPNTRRKIKPRK